MATIVTRAGKGSPLTNQELDNNFSNLNTDKAELSGATFTGAITIPDKIIHAGDTNTFLSFNAADQIQLVTGGVERVAFYNTETHFNDGGTNVDFIVESVGNANMLFVDGGENAVGIGTNTPANYYSKSLVVSVPDEDGITILNSPGQAGYLMFADGTSANAAYRGFLMYDHGSEIFEMGSAANIQINAAPNRSTVVNKNGYNADFIVESENSSHALFVDGANGNVMVGKTSTGIANAGVEIKNNGELNVIKGSGVPLNVVRSGGGSGSLQDFYTGSALTGSIGVVASEMAIGSNDAFLWTSGNNNAFLPASTVSGGASNGLLDLGSTGRRFKDLYLSGGVLAGPATSSNVGNHSNFSAASSDVQLTLERTTSSTGFGGIGANNANAFHVYNGSTQKVLQINQTDGSIQFPQSTSAGIFLGGTGAANKLSDFETGTWTPTLGGTWSTNPTNLVGSYTKIGNLVHITFSFIGGAKSSIVNGYFQGLPFATNFFGTGSVTDSAVNDKGICLFFNINRIWVSTNSFAGVTYVTGVFKTNS